MPARGSATSAPASATGGRSGLPVDHQLDVIGLALNTSSISPPQVRAKEGTCLGAREGWIHRQWFGVSPN